jgi:hypothetical protein
MYIDWTYWHDFQIYIFVDWVIAVFRNSAIFQLYDGENKLIFNDMMMWFALY